jgi:hypothetical protein
MRVRRTCDRVGAGRLEVEPAERDDPIDRHPGVDRRRDIGRGHDEQDAVRGDQGRCPPCAEHDARDRDVAGGVGHAFRCGQQQRVEFLLEQHGLQPVEATSRQRG